MSVTDQPVTVAEIRDMLTEAVATTTADADAFPANSTEARILHARADAFAEVLNVTA